MHWLINTKTESWWQLLSHCIHTSAYQDMNKYRVCLLVPTRSFEWLMAQIINNQFKVSPRRGVSLIWLLSLFSTTPEVWYEPWLDTPHLFWAAGGLLREHSNRPVLSVKIGPLSLKLTLRHTYYTHFTSLIMRLSPSEPSFTRNVFPLFAMLSSQPPFSPSCTDLEPFTSRSHQYFSCAAYRSLLFSSCYISVVSPG